MTNKTISVVIPNHNGGKTIGRCLDAIFLSKHESFEVIVADDASSDNSAELISTFPCKLVRLEKHSGASKARNAGAKESYGEILFFIDADCIIYDDTLALVQKAVTGQKNTVIGGSYTALPYDRNFFSVFQSVFINYSELKQREPDYIASHCMAIERKVFEKSGGFPEEFLPIIEDVELSHRLRRLGCKLRMEPDILVRHIFNFNFRKSMRNAFRKSLYWTMYSLSNRDLLQDSGTASRELKFNVVSYFLIISLLLLYLFVSGGAFLLPVALIAGFNLAVNRRLIRAFFHAKGPSFGFPAVLYYLFIYPAAVGAGSFSGLTQYFRKPGLQAK
jgi:GT2 family glycosyltransferase